jgi:hypothetical protein
VQRKIPNKKFAFAESNAYIEWQEPGGKNLLCLFLTDHSQIGPRPKAIFLFLRGGLQQ